MMLHAEQIHSSLLSLTPSRLTREATKTYEHASSSLKPKFTQLGLAAILFGLNHLVHIRKRPQVLVGTVWRGGSSLITFNLSSLFLFLCSGFVLKCAHLHLGKCSNRVSHQFIRRCSSAEQCLLLKGLVRFWQVDFAFNKPISVFIVMSPLKYTCRL